ncbi:MAG: hypothetical protein M1596_06810 [Firmicutes bacterium]|nr:hypothetical protein [Bacillota bacterium]
MMKTTTAFLMTFLWLFGIMAAPSLLTLFASTYRYLAPSHLIIFLLTGLTFVILGRQWKKQGHASFGPGMTIGAITGFLGSLVYQYTIRLPKAQHALFLTLNGVPSSAIWAMLNIHPLSGALVISAFSAAFYGLWGAFAAWWGSIKNRTPSPENMQTKDRL